MKSHFFLRVSSLVVTAFCFFTSIGRAAQKNAPPAKPASQYAAFDAHPAEHVTVAAEPCDRPRDCEFFRLPYVQHSLLPIRVIFTNDSDQPLSLDDARIQFLSAHNDKIPAATDEDIQRRLYSPSAAKGRQIPLPLPLPPITHHSAGPDKKIAEDDKDFGFASTTVPPHSTLAGYLFYDVRDFDDPALKGAQLYIKMVYALGGKSGDKESAKRELFPFTISFDKWLATRPATDTTQ
jgi:hypothetical protein